MASGLLPKSPVSSSLCDEVPHIFIQKSHLKPREFLISSAKRLLQHNLPGTDIFAAAGTAPTSQSQLASDRSEPFRSDADCCAALFIKADWVSKR
jgi:hypothetical protein